MLKEFRDFAMRGNVMDLAVAVIIGVAFGAIVNSLVNDILMPLIGLVLGGIDFNALAFQVGAATVKYGAFIQAVVNFLIVAFVIFLIVKQVNRFKKPVAAPEAPSTKECPYCISAVPMKAIRCPHCTSELTVGAIPAR